MAETSQPQTQDPQETPDEDVRDSESAPLLASNENEETLQDDDLSDFQGIGSTPAARTASLEKALCILNPIAATFSLVAILLIVAYLIFVNFPNNPWSPSWPTRENMPYMAIPVQHPRSSSLINHIALEICSYSRVVLAIIMKMLRTLICFRLSIISFFIRRDPLPCPLVSTLAHIMDPTLCLLNIFPMPLFVH